MNEMSAFTYEKCLKKEIQLNITNLSQSGIFPGIKSREIALGLPGEFHTIKVSLLRAMNHINTFFTPSSLNIKLLHVIIFCLLLVLFLNIDVTILVQG